MIDLRIGAILLFVLVIVICFSIRKIYRRLKLARMHSPQYRKIYPLKTLKLENSKTEVEKTPVIGMVNCEYCGALMPQLSTSCPNCGAIRRK